MGTLVFLWANAAFGLWYGWDVVFQNDKLAGAVILLALVVYVVWLTVVMWKWFTAQEKSG